MGAIEIRLVGVRPDGNRTATSASSTLAQTQEFFVPERGGCGCLAWSYLLCGGAESVPPSTLQGRGPSWLVRADARSDEVVADGVPPGGALRFAV